VVHGPPLFRTLSFFSRGAFKERERERVVSVVSIYPDDVRENEERERSTFFFRFFPSRVASYRRKQNNSFTSRHFFFESVRRPLLLNRSFFGKRDRRYRGESFLSSTFFLFPLSLSLSFFVNSPRNLL
jgi:hypothetical protein